MDKSNLKKQINEIGRAVITFDAKTNEYLYNGISPGHFHTEHYVNLFVKFNNELNTLVDDEFSVEDLRSFISLAEFEKKNLKNIQDKAVVNFATFKSAGKSNKKQDIIKQFSYIKHIFKFQNDSVEKVLSQLKAQLKYITDRNNTENFRNISRNDGELNLDSSGKVIFNLSKKESLMFVYLLEAHNILKFESNSQRNSFIENNFMYTDHRNISNDVKLFPMKDVNSEFSKIKSTDKAEVKTNNKNLESIVSKLDLLMEHKF